MNHGPNLKIINLKDQASHDFGNAPFKKTENMLINSNSKKKGSPKYTYLRKSSIFFVGVCNCLTSFNKRAHYGAHTKCYSPTWIKRHPLGIEGDEIEVL